MKLKVIIFPIIYFLKMCYLCLGYLKGGMEVCILFINSDN